MFAAWGLFFKWRGLFLIRVWVFIAMSTVNAIAATQAQDIELPVFPKDYADEFVGGEDPFVDVMAAYRAHDYAKSLKILEDLAPDLPPGGPSAETAAFLLGDLHLKLAKKGDRNRLRQAISAFQKAGQAFPQSDNATRGLWRVGLANTRLRLYPEAGASYTRILKYHPKSQYAGLAQLGIAHTLRTQGKWKEAEQTYKKAENYTFPPSEANALLLGQADVQYHLQAFEDAYKNYSQATKNKSDYWRGEPQSLFQHGDTAYRTKHYPEARKALMLFFNVYGSDALAPVAFTMAGEAWRHEGKEQEAQKIFNIVKTLDKTTTGMQLARLLTAVGEMEVDECVMPSKSKKDTKPRTLPLQCLQNKAERVDQDARALSTIGSQTRAILNTQLKGQSPSFVMSEILLESAHLHRKRGDFNAALEIQNRLLGLLPKESSPFHKRLLSAMNETITDGINDAAAKQDDLRVIKLFYAYPASFTPKMLTEVTGMIVANSFVKMGLLTPSLDLYEPVSVSVVNPFSQEALIQLARVLIQQGDYSRARDKIKQFLSRYPKSARVPEVKAILAEMFEHEGEKDRAMLEYQNWLRLYPKHPYQRHLSLKLAQIYRQKGDSRKEVEVYLRLMRDEPKTVSHLAIHVADGYYKLQEYKKAIEFYEKALQLEGIGGEANWAQLQLANSFYALGRKEEGKVIYTRLGQNTDDLLMKHLASEKVRTRD